MHLGDQLLYFIINFNSVSLIYTPVIHFIVDVKGSETYSRSKNYVFGKIRLYRV